MSRLSLCKQSQLHITFHNNYERTLNFHDNLPLDGAVSREPRISQEDGDMYDEFTYESGLRVDGEEAFAIAMQDLKTKAARYPDIVDFPGLPHVLLNSLIVLPGELFDGKTRTAEIANLAAVADWVRAYNSYLVIECPAAQKMVIEEWVGEGAVNFIEPQDPKGLNELSTSIRLGAPKVYYFTPEGKIGDAATTYGEIQGIEFKKFAMPVDGTQYISLLDLISLAGYALQSETIDALIPAPAYATQVDAVHEALKRVIDAGV